MKTISCSWPWDPGPPAPGISVMSAGEDAQLMLGVPGPVDEDVDACSSGVGAIENRNRNDHCKQ